MALRQSRGTGVIPLKERTDEARDVDLECGDAEEAEGGEEAMMRRVLRVSAVLVLVLLTLISWYTAGFFARYEIVVGEERHFGLWSNVSTALMYVFGTAAVWVALKGRKAAKKR